MNGNSNAKSNSKSSKQSSGGTAGAKNNKRSYSGRSTPSDGSVKAGDKDKNGGVSNGSVSLPKLAKLTPKVAPKSTEVKLEPKLLEVKLEQKQTGAKNGAEDGED